MSGSSPYLASSVEARSSSAAPARPAALRQRAVCSADGTSAAGDSGACHRFSQVDEARLPGLYRTEAAGTQTQHGTGTSACGQK